jgi:glutathione S-transferase
MIKLHQFPPLYGLPNASPFCLKVETWLRMAGLPFEVVDDFDMGKAPKGKMPYIEDNGKKIADSGLILEYLKSSYGDSLDAHLNVKQKAVTLAFTRVLDEHLYWSQIYVRWLDPVGWARTKADFFTLLPAPLRLFVPTLARRGMKQQFWGQGMGRHSPEEIYSLANADLDALADWLGEQPFFHGETPSSLDAVAYAYLANLLWTPFDSPVKSHAAALPRFEDFCLRMKAKYY